MRWLLWFAAGCYVPTTRVVVRDPAAVEARSETATLERTQDAITATGTVAQPPDHVPVASDHVLRTILDGDRLDLPGAPRHVLRTAGSELHAAYRFGAPRECTKHETGIVLVGHCETPTFDVDVATASDNIARVVRLERKNPLRLDARITLGVLAGLFAAGGTEIAMASATPARISGVSLATVGVALAVALIVEARAPDTRELPDTAD